MRDGSRTTAIKHYKTSTTSQDNFIENNRDINDETFLFRVNASKPLVVEQREAVRKSTNQASSALGFRP